ncbi:tRNA (adenine(22)-N(1))-methyltransferase [Companilactobacillus futsaii]|uniref:SAM-dependent methyltransferase n=2 Tax=Companilactobacillus futsaii TaxID=938155 RepID=A0A5B7T2G0_9LACO|nr:class I SAM-dependent methyltransferase [Companilactobacillus futsaii]KRK99744.1 SAM-dependent methyltransferase [Companilactobacillus futsaii JCM 17355]QCX24719.1 SAM-dependent methyltransferase [Companilactobacillus futsaii]
MTLLSKRLQAVYQMVDKNTRVADIGSDHAYLPVELLETNIASFAIAGEVAKGPMSRSKEDVDKFGLSAKIDVRLGDGLAVINENDEIDTVVIAGMGGILIKDILTRATEEQLSNVKTLILQPNIGEPLVRHWLVENNFEIIDEDIIAEEHHVYEIIKAQKVNRSVSLTEAQYLMGPVLMQKKTPTFIAKWEHKLNSFKKAVANMHNAKVIDQEKIAAMNQDIKYIEEIL